MILFFHFLCLLARYIVINISKSIRQRKEISDESEMEEAVKNLSRSYLLDIKDVKPPEYRNQILRFFPPIYVQRYETVALILQSFAEDGIIRKVVEFGCAELGLLPYLKNIESIREIYEVDINEEVLTRSAFKAAPLTTDYLISKGVRPLDIYLLAGNVADYDDRLAGCDTVVCIELIEHLNEEDFYKMPYNIFHQIKPKVAIFTTPNADFNTLFPNFEGMRHEDHKFEWTRKEFYLWTQGIISQYHEYSVRFYGVGAGPEGTENLGCCSQVAVFNRSDDFEPFSSAREEPEGILNYKLMAHYKYPVFTDTRTTEEKVLHEIQYQLSYLSTLPTYYNYDENETAVPVALLKESVKDYCLSDAEFLNILKNAGLELRSNNNSWYLIAKESEAYSSGTSFEEEEWLNKDLSRSLYADDGGNLDENWDSEPPLELTNFQTVRSLEESIALERIKVAGVPRSPLTIDKTLSAPSSSNKLSELLAAAEGSNVKEYLQRPKKCRIPVVKKAGRDSVTGRVKEASRVREPFDIISKPSSLDFSDVPGERRTESGSSLFDRAGDSGCPFSYSSPENETSRSTPSSSEADLVSATPRPSEDEAPGNGNSAYNGRDPEGNCVDGSTIDERGANDDVFFPENDEFPPRLLNFGHVARRPLVFPADLGGEDDEGVGEDASSASDQSLELDEFYPSFEI